MKAKKELATELRKLACLFRESVKEQNLKALARKLDLLLPARAAKILCFAFDGGILGSDASWDLRDLSLTPEEIESEQADLQEHIARLDVHFNDVRAIALRRREIEDDREVLKNKAALDDDLAHVCTWWKYIELIWKSDRMRFPVDIEQHFILEDGDNSGKHIYSPYDDKQTRIRLRLDSSANAQATACEILADRIERTSKRGSREVEHDRTKKELVKSALQLHHHKPDDTIAFKPLTHRQIEKLTGRHVSATTAGRILHEWFDPAGGYRKACKDRTVVVRLNALDDGLKFIQTVALSTLAKYVTADGKSTRSHRKSKPVDDD